MPPSLPHDTATGNTLVNIQHVVVTPSGSTYTVSNYAETKLLKMLDDANAPHFLYNDILEWASDIKAKGYPFEPKHKSGTLSITHLEKRFCLKYCKSEQVPVIFSDDNLKIKITWFQFVSQLYSLLSDKSLTGDLT